MLPQPQIILRFLMSCDDVTPLVLQGSAHLHITCLCWDIADMALPYDQAGGRVKQASFLMQELAAVLPVACMCLDRFV